MRGKQILFTIILIMFVLMVGIGGSDLILRYKQQRIQNSDSMDADLIRYDRDLGWSLSSNWRGQHKHYDFSVSYSTNRDGFRGELSINPDNTVARYAVLGDSFTFGFGVNDDETFVHLLHTANQPDKSFLNLAVPGYSTDQEWLLLQRRALKYNPTHLMLVVYLGNDLYDNQLPFPLQADNAKPYFELSPENSELILKNSPVPLEKKTFERARSDRQRVLGFWDDSLTNRNIARFFDKFPLFRLLKLQFSAYPDFTPELAKHHIYTLRLFTAIIQEIQIFSREKQMGLTIVLLPGQSFIKRPNAPDAQSQEYFRKKIAAILSQIQVEVIDVALLLRERYSQHPGNWYHPNEGHLTVEGHRIVADILSRHINEEDE